MDGYQNGTTPNPDILCNKYIKFGALFDHVMKHLDVDWLATGHYAKLEYSKEGKVYSEQTTLDFILFCMQ